MPLVQQYKRRERHERRGSIAQAAAGEQRGALRLARDTIESRKEDVVLALVMVFDKGLEPGFGVQHPNYLPAKSLGRLPRQEPEHISEARQEFEQTLMLAHEELNWAARNAPRAPVYRHQDFFLKRDVGAQLTLVVIKPRERQREIKLQQRLLMPQE